jgi:hypothetical protein
MKKLFVIAVLGSVLLVSCKKSSSGGGVGLGTVQATVSGTTTTFTNGAAISSNSGSVIAIAAISGAGTSSASGFTIDIESPNAITVGTYTDTSTNNIGGFGILYTSTGAQYSTLGLVSNPAKVVVTSISSTAIAGTFQGSIYANGDSTSAPKVITNGKFNLKITAE